MTLKALCDRHFKGGKGGKGKGGKGGAKTPLLRFIPDTTASGGQRIVTLAPARFTGRISRSKFGTLFRSPTGTLLVHPHARPVLSAGSQRRPCTATLVVSQNRGVPFIADAEAEALDVVSFTIQLVAPNLKGKGQGKSKDKGKGNGKGRVYDRAVDIKRCTIEVEGAQLFDSFLAFLAAKGAGQVHAAGIGPFYAAHPGAKDLCNMARSIKIPWVNGSSTISVNGIRGLCLAVDPKQARVRFVNGDHYRGGGAFVLPMAATTTPGLAEIPSAELRYILAEQLVEDHPDLQGPDDVLDIAVTPPTLAHHLLRLHAAFPPPPN